MLLMDVNVLVYAHRQDMKNHLTSFVNFAGRSNSRFSLGGSIEI